jgi:hypothetical protein
VHCGNDNRRSVPRSDKGIRFSPAAGICITTISETSRFMRMATGPDSSIEIAMGACTTSYCRLFGLGPARLFFLEFQDQAALVVPAVRAGSVRQMHLIALRAAGQRRGGNRMVGPPFVPPGFGRFVLWYTHFLNS